MLDGSRSSYVRSVTTGGATGALGVGIASGGVEGFASSQLGLGLKTAAEQRVSLQKQVRNGLPGRYDVTLRVADQFFNARQSVQVGLSDFGPLRARGEVVGLDFVWDTATEALTLQPLTGSGQL